MVQEPTSGTFHEPIGVLIVDDHELVRLGVRTLLDSHARAWPRTLEWFEAASLSQALSIYAQRAPRIQLVLLDLHLPDAHGLLGLQTFLRHYPAALVAVISGNTDPSTVRQTLHAGAKAFLCKTGNMQEVIDFVGQMPVGHSGSGRPTATIEDASTERRPRRTVRASNGVAVELTSRQSQILDALLSGLSNRDIAERVCLSEGTIKNHVSQLLLSFGVRSRSQLLTLLR